jgi:methyl-accepting chemotaxis protein
MNKTRRKELNSLQDRIEAAKIKLLADIESFTAELGEIETAIEELAEQEQEAYDNLTEGLQNSDRGGAMQDAVILMEEAKGVLESARFIVEDIDGSDLDAAFESLDNAKGMAK